MKRIALGSFILLCLGAGLWFYPSDSVTPLKIKSSKTPSSSRKVFLGARSKTITPSIVQNSCDELTSRLEDMDFNIPLEDWIMKFSANDFKECVLPEYSDRFQDIQIHCFEKLSEKECLTDAILLRAILRTRGIADSEDRDLMADLILSEFANKTKIPDFEKLEKLSARMLEIDPDQASYQKLWASSKVIAKLSKGKSVTNLETQINERVNPEVWNDPNMKGVKLAMMTGLEPENVEEYARGYLSQKSDSSMHEVLGWSLWRQNRRAEALVELQTAMKLNPNDVWLKQQLIQLNSDSANSESYQARISLGIDVRDLYN